VTKPADNLLRQLGFAPLPGPGPGGWLQGSDPWWDLRSCNLRELVRAKGLGSDALHELVFKRVCFGDRERDKDPADLTLASFKTSEFEHVSFVNTPLTGVYFRDCKFTACDFRYTHMTETSFQDSRLNDCDFYRGFFEAANVFTGVRFNRVSLDKTWLAGVSGLTKQMFTKCAMVQECDEETYLQFLDATTGDRPASHTLEEALEKAKLDVAKVYRALSGMWTAQGQLSDAGFAYVKCKTLEREFYSPLRRWATNRARDKRNSERQQLADADETILDADKLALKNSKKEDHVALGPKQIGPWLALVAAWGVANFGESMRLIAVWLALLILVPGIIFSKFGGVQTDGKPPHAVHFLPRCILFSFEQLTASVHHLQSTNSVVDLVGSAQIFIGVALLGLLGFTLANRLRNA
jgi:uncharacterized protein YjbI with pentapeptide repeats